MQASTKEYTFKRFLVTRHEVKVYFIVSVVFAAKQASTGAGFILELCFNSLIATCLSFVEYRLLKGRMDRGESIEVLRHELTRKRYPNLFKLAKADYRMLEQRAQECADTECAGNIRVAIDLLEAEEVASNSKKVQP